MSGSNPYRIIVIDDNEAIHDDFKKILLPKVSQTINHDVDEDILFGTVSLTEDFQNYTIDCAYQGEEGLKMVKSACEQGKPYALAFVDIRMPPGWDGVETIQKIWEADPNIQTVICTAYSDYSWVDLMKILKPSDKLLILKKPFDNIEIRQVTSALCTKWMLEKQAKLQTDELKKIIDEKTFKIKHSNALLRATLESTADGILVVNTNNKIIDFNANFLEIWNVSRKILHPDGFNELKDFLAEQFYDKQEFFEKMKLLSEKTETEAVDIWKTSNHRVIEVYTKPQVVNNDIVGRVWSFRDITEKKRLEEALFHQATHDTLTGLYNRASLVEHLNKAITQSKRHDEKIAVFFFDLDNFKLINDSLGHTVGDALLRAIALRLTAAARKEDIIARLGGDEFIILSPRIDDEQDIISIIKRYLIVMNQSFNIGENSLTITSSIGISIYPKDGQNSESLIKSADMAMYRAKEMGRNNFQFFTFTMNMQVQKRLEMENDLRQAIKEKQFFLNYQPLYNLKNKQLIGFEALIRWNHPTHGLINPVEFIPIAEKAGLISQISEWVLETACSQNKEWQNQGLHRVWMSVNISPYHFIQKDFLETIENVLNKTQLDPKYLCLEITENVLLESKLHVQNTIEKLKARGLMLAIDDFGTGYSSLGYVSNFPIDKLKIDRSFIRNIGDHTNDSAVIIAILGMAKSLHLKVLAEGVETEEQLEFLRHYNCDEIQGFYFSKPLDLTDCTNLLKSEK